MISHLRLAFSGYANMEEATTSPTAPRHYDVVAKDDEISAIAVGLHVLMKVKTKHYLDGKAGRR